MAPTGLGGATTTADQATLVATLADVPLDVRVQGALDAILSGAVAELAERYAVLAVALWPPDVHVPGVTQPHGPKHPWPTELRTAAVTAYQAGEGSFKLIAGRFDVPRTTLTMWVRHTGTTRGVAPPVVISA